jgi:tRNA-2-methylthio-N6-dimethylallyladenosine synthase
MSVLFEHAGRKDGQAVGRSPYLQPVHVEDAMAMIGQIVAVRIEAVLSNSLKGRLISQASGLEAHREKALAD